MYKRINLMGRRLLVMVMALGLLIPHVMAAERSYVLATATVGGTYYPVGVALSTLVKVRLHPTQGSDMTAISSEGSLDNVRLLREDQAQFAILSGLTGYYAWTGQGPFRVDGPQTGLRSVSILWQEPEHFVVKQAYARTGTIEDMHHLKGKKVSLGMEGSGTIGLSRLLLGNLGIDIDSEMDLVYLGYDAGAEALQRGQIEAMSAPAGVPVTAVSQAKRTLGDRVVILEFTDEQLERADGGLGLWIRYVIEADTYPGQEQGIKTIATPSFLAVRADVDEEDVYQITKTIYENLPFLRIIHKALQEASLDRALTGLPIPLHPGALRYYREVGLEVPANLIAE